MAVERTENAHVVTIEELVLRAQDGLMLGNGDLSVSIYQKPGEIVWRFGKGDVWDRRHIVEDNADPLTMDELRDGIENQGWRCPAYGGEVEAVHGTRNPKRMLEALEGPPSQSYPYPMPKPVGELSLHWPADLQNLRIKQQLFIEQGRVEIECVWGDDEKLTVDCFIHPELNVLVVRWNLTGFHPGSPQPFFKTLPVWLSLYRWADPTIADVSAKWKAEYACPMHEGFVNPKATPLPVPEVVEHQGNRLIEQRFYPDDLFQEGFRYWLGCFSNLANVETVDTRALQEARLMLSTEASADYEFVKEFMKVDSKLRDGTLEYPEGQDYGGWIAVPVTTSSDTGGEVKEFELIAGMIGSDAETVLNQWEQESRDQAESFWSQSAIRVSEETLEKLWYETLHVSRCLYRGGTVPPGLFMPSTIHDYSLWHSDYHTNYNIQQVFWGFGGANHPELDEAYFTIMDFLKPMGDRIAREYCRTRGTFIQISAYPIGSDDDTYSTGPMGRMPYMTGYVAELYWWHYLYTGDKEFLRDKGYPFLRDCALFYTDFLQLGDDGEYHAFPSCWGEEGYDGTKEKNTDALQTMEYARSCMMMASRAADALGVDEELRRQWLERIGKLAMGQGDNEWRPLPTADEQRHREYNVPGFVPGENYRFPNKWPWAKRWWGWMDKLTISWIRDVRGGQFKADRDFDELLKVLRRWRHPNGLLWPMPIRYYGTPGGWTEILGVITPVQEMMLQSWDGRIAVFPAWPDHVDAEFDKLRAMGAFLVSAACKGGQVGELVIESLNAEQCNVANPWPGSMAAVTNNAGKNVLKDDADVLVFDTVKGGIYTVAVVN